MYVDGQVWFMPEYRTGLIRLWQFCVLFASVIDFLIYIVRDIYIEPSQHKSTCVGLSSEWFYPCWGQLDL